MPSSVATTMPAAVLKRSVVCDRFTLPAGAPYTGGKLTTTSFPRAWSSEIISPSQVPP